MDPQNQNGEGTLDLMNKYATPKEFFEANNVQPVPLPKMTSVKYDIPAKSLVSVALESGSHFTGTLLVNPSSTANSSGVSLIQSTEAITGYFYRDTLTFFAKDIKFVTVLWMYKDDTPRYETCMPTFVVTNAAQMDNLVEALKEVDEVAMSFHGKGSGRYGNVTWVALCVKDNFIAIDVDALESLDTKYHAWVALKNTLFENENIVKIVHDARPISDFLYNKSGEAIRINNVFDTMICDLIAKTIAMKEIDCEFKDRQPANVRPVFIKLYEMIHQYIPECAFEREVVILVRYYNKSLQKNNNMNERPLALYAKKYMALTVKYLSQLKKELTKRLLNRQINMCEIYVNAGILANMAEALHHCQDAKFVPDFVLKQLEEPVRPLSPVNVEPMHLSDEKYSLKNLSKFSSVSSSTDDEGSIS